MNDEDKNLQAWELLDEALFTSSHVKRKDIEKGSTDWENVYPTSLEETDRMEDLVDRAVQEADDAQEEDFRNRVNELREVISWSRETHSTWNWKLIVGSLIAVGILWYSKGQADESKAEAEATLAKVEAWTECDTTLTYAQVGKKVGYTSRYQSANKYKAYELYQMKHSITSSESYLKETRQRLDTASTDEMKERLKGYISSSEESVKENKKRFAEVSAMKYDDIRKMALEEANRSLDFREDAASSSLFWVVYTIALIPVYILTGYSKGYQLSRYRRQDKVLNFIQRWSFRIAAVFFGTGFALSLLPDDLVRYTYSSGYSETRREANPANIIVVGTKILLMLIGVFIFSFVSVFIMSVQAFLGLKHRIKWGELAGKFSKK